MTDRKPWPASLRPSWLRPSSNPAHAPDEPAAPRDDGQYRAILDGLTDYAVILLDHRGIVTEWTTGAERLIGYGAGEAIGQPLSLLYVGDAAEERRVDDELVEAARTGRMESEGWRCRKDGGQFWANEITTAVHDDEGTLRAFTRISRDMTEQRQTQIAITTRHDHYRRLFDEMDLGYCVIEVMFDVEDRPYDFIFRETNPAFETNTGLTDVIGKRMRSLVPGNEQWWYDLYGQVALTGTPARLERQTASLGRWFTVYAIRLGDPSERRVTVLFSDITDRHRVEVERESAQQVAARAVAARDQFLSVAAHELRTPITSLKGTAQLAAWAVRRGTITPERLEHYLATMVDGTERLVTLVDDLFDLSRVQAGVIGPRSMTRKPTDLAALVRSAATRYDRSGERPRLVLDLAEGPPLWVDAGRVEQAIANLVDNALTYSPAECDVTISLRFDQSGAEVTVLDEGIGLPIDDYESIFQPFIRGANATARAIPGLGLGLYIAREIIEAHGGRLWAESRGEGQGTVVGVRLPRRSSDAVTSPVSA